MSNVIDTKSKLFKLYAARRLRKTGAWDIEEVIRDDVDTINICSYVRNIALEVGLHTMKALGLITLGVIAGMMILAPVVSWLLWLFTDNPFIWFFGELGRVISMIDAALLMFIALGFTMHFLFDSQMSKDTRAHVVSEVKTMTAKNVFVMWIKSYHNKFCIKLDFDRKSKLTDDENGPKWDKE